MYIDQADKPSAEALAGVDGESFREFGEKLSGTPSEITIAAHTDETRGKIGDMTPREFAQQFSKKYGSQKPQLKHLYLISCEAGLMVDGQTLAQQIALEMNQQGFTNLEVHAMAAPIEGATGMRVEVVSKEGLGTGGVSARGQVSVFYYESKELEEIDERIAAIDAEILGIYKEGQEMRRKGTDNPDAVNQRQSRIAALEQEQRTLEQQRAQSIAQRIDLVSTTNYKSVMREDQNTFLPTGPKGVVHQDLVSAIGLLQKQRKSLIPQEGEKVKNPGRSLKAIGYIDETIHKLKENPRLDGGEIIDLLRRMKEGENEKGKKHTGTSAFKEYVLNPIIEDLTKKAATRSNNDNFEPRTKRELVIKHLMIQKQYAQSDQFQPKSKLSKQEYIARVQWDIERLQRRSDSDFNPEEWIQSIKDRQDDVYQNAINMKHLETELGASRLPDKLEPRATKAPQSKRSTSNQAASSRLAESQSMFRRSSSSIDESETAPLLSSSQRRSEPKPVTHAPKPLSQTTSLIRVYGKKLRDGSISDDELRTLLTEDTFKKSSQFDNKKPISDNNHRTLDAMRNFVGVIAPSIAPEILHELNDRMLNLADQDKLPKTYLRNNSLAKVMLAYETFHFPDSAEDHYRNNKRLSTLFTDREKIGFQETLISPNVEYFSLQNMKRFYTHAADWLNPSNRTHSFEANGDHLKKELQEFKGDALKTSILKSFKKELDNCDSTDDLKETVTRLKETDEYKTLATGQDRTTRILGLKTSSVKAFEQMIAEKEKELEPANSKRLN